MRTLEGVKTAPRYHRLQPDLALDLFAAAGQYQGTIWGGPPGRFTNAQFRIALLLLAGIDFCDPHTTGYMKYGENDLSSGEQCISKMQSHNDLQGPVGSPSVRPRWLVNQTIANVARNNIAEMDEETIFPEYTTVKIIAHGKVQPKDKTWM